MEIREYNTENPYAQAAVMLKGVRDMYFIMGDLQGFAHFQGQFLNMKRQADVYEMTMGLSRPINWNGGR